MKSKRRGFVDFLEVERLDPSDKSLRVYVEFTDGAQGVVDMSEIAWKPVFASWNNGGFCDVRLENGIPCWGEDNHVSPEWMRRRIVEMSREEWECSQRPATVIQS